MTRSTPSTRPAWLARLLAWLQAWAGPVAPTRGARPVPALKFAQKAATVPALVPALVPVRVRPLPAPGRPLPRARRQPTHWG